MYSEYIPETANQTGLKRAAQIRKGRISEQKLATHYGLRSAETEAPAVPFSELAQAYLDCADLAASTRSNYKNALNKYWVPILGSIPVAMITTKDIRLIMSRLTKITRKTQRNILIPLRRVMKYAVDMEYLIADPSAAISIRKGQKPLPDPFTLQEREAILDQLQGQAYFFYLFAFETGLRNPSEILALQWSDYDGKQLSISKARVLRKMKATKTNEARKVFVTQRLKTELEKQKVNSSSEWMFVNSLGNPCLDSDLFNCAWRKALTKAGVRYRRGYTCRHTYASLGLKAHAQPAFLASQLGHSLQMFYTTYAKWISEDDDVADLQRIEEYTEGGRKGGRKPDSELLTN
jgi:integrase